MQLGYLQHLLPSEAPEEGEDFDTILQDVQERIVPGKFVYWLVLWHSSVIQLHSMRECMQDSCVQEYAAQRHLKFACDPSGCAHTGVTHWQSPNFFAYYPANSSFPAMLGDMLSSAFNVIGFSWISSPACTELESVCALASLVLLVAGACL